MGYHSDDMEKEYIIKVDINDNQLGTIEKLAAHKTPVLHRAFSVFLYDGNKILLQQRAFDKYHSGGLWANSCCSHPRPNVPFLQSVQQRVQFELGIEQNLQLTKVFCFTYLSKYAEDLFEYEFDHVLIAPYKEQKINFNAAEIAKVEWVDTAWLKQDMTSNPQKYATWFLICAPKVIEYLEKKNRPTQQK